MEIKYYLEKFKKLKLPLSQYAIFGSGPMAVREIRKCFDLDVVVTNALYQDLIKKYPEKEKGFIKIGDIEIYSTRNSSIDSPKKVIARAETIKGLKFIRLEDLIVWKRKRGHQKDLEDIKLINTYLKNQKN